MGRNRRDKKKSYRRNTYGSGKFLMLFNDVREHNSYRFLTPAQRLVLQEFLYSYNIASRNDTEQPEPFSFTWEHCKETIGKTAFYEAMEVLRIVGWLQVSEQRISSLCAVLKYSSSQNWREFDPNNLADSCKTRPRLLRQWKKFLRQTENKKKAILKDKRKKTDLRLEVARRESSVLENERKSNQNPVVPKVPKSRIPRVPPPKNGSRYSAN